MRTLASALLAACLLPCGAASAQTDDDRARTHFEAGLLHYEEGAYDRALTSRPV